MMAVYLKVTLNEPNFLSNFVRYLLNKINNKTKENELDLLGVQGAQPNVIV